MTVSGAEAPSDGESAMVGSSPFRRPTGVTAHPFRADYRDDRIDRDRVVEVHLTRDAAGIFGGR